MPLNFHDALIQAAAVEVGQILDKKSDNSQPRRLITESEQIKVCREKVERYVLDSGYDNSGIQPKDWDVLMDIAGRRRARADYNDLKRYCEEKGWAEPEEVKRDDTGVILMGLPGCGKTMLLNLLTQARAFPKMYGEVSIVLTAESGGVDSVFKKYSAIEKGDVSLDDIGLTGNIRTYGNSNLIDKILLYRYEMWSNHGYATYITTNISSYQDFLNRFCQQIADRVFEMCYHVIISGGSKRISARNRKN